MANAKEHQQAWRHKDKGATRPDKKFSAKFQVGAGEANYWPSFVRHKAKEVDVFTQKAIRKARFHKS